MIQNVSNPSTWDKHLGFWDFPSSDAILILMALDAPQLQPQLLWLTIEQPHRVFHPKHELIHQASVPTRHSLLLTKTHLREDSRTSLDFWSTYIPSPGSPASPSPAHLASSHFVFTPATLFKWQSSGPPRPWGKRPAPNSRGVNLGIPIVWLVDVGASEKGEKNTKFQFQLGW